MAEWQQPMNDLVLQATPGQEAASPPLNGPPAGRLAKTDSTKIQKSHNIRHKPSRFLVFVLSIYCFTFWLRWVFVATHRFSSCEHGLQAQASSITALRLSSVARRLSCSTTCGIFPDHGSHSVSCIVGGYIPLCTTRNPCTQVSIKNNDFGPSQ